MFCGFGILCPDLFDMPVPDNEWMEPYKRQTETVSTDKSRKTGGNRKTNGNRKNRRKPQMRTETADTG